MSVLGKRRRPHTTGDADDTASDSSDEDAKARALFQRAFEAKFKPLPQQPPPTNKGFPEQIEEPSEPEHDDWDGLSEASVPIIEIVQIRDPVSGNDQASQPQDLKAFMSSRLSTARDQTKGPASKVRKDADDGDEAANLKNDVALQRLLKESHLLDASSYSSTGTDVRGKSRLKALDQRIQDLGGKTSHLEQKKMPLSHRRGIAEKATNREQKRRKEAAESGVVLEKAKFASKSSKPRDTGLGDPSIGRFKGGMLKLSNKDLNGMKGSGSNTRGKSRRDR